MTSMVRIGSAAESNDGSLFTSTETLGSIGRLVDSFEKFVLSHFTGREGGMTTVWRPRVRIPVPDIDGADADENRRDESTKKGTKRKSAPRHYGPCEHGVKYRSKCKVCSACPHGRRAL